MISTRFVKLAVSSLAVGMALTGGHAGPVTSAESSSDARQLAVASTAAAKATAALAAHNYGNAIKAAETAVSYSPRDAAYRMLLGQAYLSAGRFASAETSFADTLTLSPDNSRAALNLALAEIAQGKHDAAMTTLGDYRDKFAAADYGLALALAGDVDAGVGALEAAVRDGGADAKTRQNLALAYAMAGKWSNARVMAGQDLSSDDVDTRLGQWMLFVHPKSAPDQVASLLGVTPVEDAGQPSRLALNGFADTAVAMAEPARAPVAVAAAEPVPQSAVVEAAPAAFETAAVTAPSGIVMAERREVVQPIPASYARPAPMIRAATTATKQVIVPRAKPAPTIAAAVQPKPVRSVQAGKFVVQLGAFENAAVSRDAWKRMSGRYGLSNYDPANSAARVGGTSFVRLSVGGFTTRADANYVCTRIRSAGGTCFVRGLLGDAPAQWVMRGMPKMPAKLAKPIRVASR
jgi:Flp pilus assembly protein TadD/cell division septation protein DedD